MPDDITAGSEEAASNGRKRRRRARYKRGGGSGARPRRRQANVYAALDLGTNNCRLLIAKDSGDAFKIIDSYSRVVRLGQGLAATGTLSDESINAAVEAMAVCAA